MTKYDVTEFKFIGKTKKRAVYLLPGGKNVIKVPLNEQGLHNNYLEDFRYRFQKSKWYSLARCRLLKNGCLVMEYIEVIDKPYDLKLYWVDMVDCGQVGYNRLGEVVAYDYGD